MNPIDAGLLPDPIVRFGIRRLLTMRLVSERRRAADHPRDAVAAHADALRQSPIAVSTADANAQHYELPPAFFEQVLGRHLKYSAGYWPDEGMDLEASETAALELVVARAELEDGQEVLDLGCGWGALTLYLAERFPRSRITAVSNSALQREVVLARARRAGLDNVRALTADIVDFEPGHRFDRICSIEMLEHVRNYEALFARVARWLAPGGRFFVHVFTHRLFAYLFEDHGPSDWMARHFFSGGQMPSADLLLHFQRDLAAVQRWHLGGKHYQKTAEAWLERMDLREEAVRVVLLHHVGADEAKRQWHRWRVFFMAVAELFGYDRGREWGVSQYLFAPAGEVLRPALGLEPLTLRNAS